MTILPENNTGRVNAFVYVHNEASVYDLTKNTQMVPIQTQASNTPSLIQPERCIVLADSDEQSRRNLRDVLGEYNVVEFSDGQEAFEFVQENHRKISLILVDFDLPTVSGTEMLKQIIREPILSSIPVVVLTGDATGSNEVECLSLGAADFISAPFNPLIVSHRIRNLVRLHESSAALSAVEIDPTSGLLTRQAFYYYAEDFVKLHKDESLCLIVGDIEHFDELENFYGIRKVHAFVSYVGQRLTSHENHSVSAHLGNGRFVTIIIRPENVSTDWYSAYVDALIEDSPLPTVKCRLGVYDQVSADDNLHTVVRRSANAIELAPSPENRISCTLIDVDTAKQMKEDEKALADIISALDQGEFQLYFQPKCHIPSGKIVGAEALVRRVRPDGTVVPPAQFIPLMERQGLITRLDQYVWDEAFRIMRNWIDMGLDPLPISVNVSRYDLATISVSAELKRLARKHNVPPRLVEVEITESAYAGDESLVRAEEHVLKEAGFTILIDDFGKGLSSLSMLRDVDADVLKLDMRFLRIEEDGGGQKGIDIIRSVFEMAHQLDMAIIVEGMETQAQMDMLVELGCQFVQGFFLYKPMPESSYRVLLGQNGLRASIEISRHAVRKSNMQRIVECFWRVAEVNPYTSEYRFIRNAIDPAAIVTPRPATLYEYTKRNIELDCIHPADEANYLHFFDPENIMRSVDKEDNHTRHEFRYHEPNGFRWYMVDIVRPDDFSKNNPWLIVTWSAIYR